MSSILYLLRHGETDFSARNVLGGGDNPPLNANGQEQARKTANLMKNFQIDAFFCSPLIRSRQTAEAIHQFHLDKPLTEISSLVEMDVGEISPYTKTEFKTKFPGLVESRNKDKFNWAFPGGESYAMVMERIKPFIDVLRKKTGNFAVVGHYTVNRIIIAYILGLGGEEIRRMIMPNVTVFLVDLQSSHPEIYHYYSDGNRRKGLLYGQS